MSIQIPKFLNEITFGKALTDDTYLHIRPGSHNKDVLEKKQISENYISSDSDIFAKVVAQSPAAIALTDTEGYIVYINPAGCELSGYTRPEIIGLKSSHFMQGYLSETEQSKMLQLLHSGNMWSASLKNRKKDGSSYWSETFISPIYGKNSELTNFLIVKHDVSEKVADEKRFFQTREKFKSLLSNIPLGIFELSLAKKVESWNNAAEDILGYSRAEILGQPISTVFKKSEFANYIKLAARATEAKDAQRAVIQNRKKDGSLLYCLWFVTPIMSSDKKVSGLVCLVQDVTSRVMLQKELERKDLRNTTILDNTHEMILIADEFGQIKYANQAFMSTFLSKNSTYSGRKIFDFVHSDVLKAFIDTYSQTFKSGKETHREVAFVGHTGQRVIVNLKAVLISDFDNQLNVQLFMHNVTKESISRQHYVKINNELSMLIETVNAPIFEVDSDFLILSWNRAAANLTGFERSKVVNRSIFDIMVDEYSQDQFKQLVSETVDGDFSKDREIEFKTTFGNTIKWLVSINPNYNTGDSFLSITCVARDITELDKYAESLENEVGKRTRQLKEALAKERELGEMKTKFISMASHEFRTPLTAINFAAGFLKKYNHKLDKEAQNKKLDKIQTQIKHITSLLDDVLTTGKADEGKLKYQPEVFCFDDFIQPIIDDVLERFEYSHIIIPVEVQKGIQVALDRELGVKIFNNLLSNAVKYSPDSKIIELSYYAEDAAFVFSVKDFGIGIKSQDFPHLFDRFFRGDNVETIQGTGLGLPIVKEAVDLHGGSIKVESEEGRFTKFIVTLPR